MIDAGSLDCRVRVMGATTTKSATGVEKTTFGVVATVWAARQALNLRESTRMAGTSEAIERKFVIRYRDGVSTANQIEYEDQRFAIIAVDELGRREGLALIVRAI